ncbi:hypothetical protein M5D96_011409, partial [Drosophila gunungcola]
HKAAVLFIVSTLYLAVFPEPQLEDPKFTPLSFLVWILLHYFRQLLSNNFLHSYVGISFILFQTKEATNLTPTRCKMHAFDRSAKYALTQECENTELEIILCFYA